MNENEALANSGDWWSNPWWKQPGREVYCPFTEEQLSRAADILKRHFDSGWTRNMAANPCRNVVFPNLCIGGSEGALRFVTYIGEVLGALEGSDGSARVIAALKGEKSYGALLEIEAAYAFSEANYRISFPPEGEGKSPDVIAELGDTQLAIECKRLEPELWERWEEQLLMALMQALARLDSAQQSSVSIFLNPRLSQVCMGGKHSLNLDGAFRDAIVRAIVTAVTDALDKRKATVEFAVRELAYVRIAPKTDSDLGQISGMEKASPALTRRILQNGVMRAYEQLPDHMPGVVFVYSKTIPDPEFFRTFLEATCRTGRGMSRLVAVVLCPLQTMFERPPPIIFANLDSQYILTLPAILEVLTSKFGGSIC